MRELIRTAAAEADLDEILEYLNTYSPPAADKFVADFTARCELLPSQPNTGRPRSDLVPGMRSVVVGRYVVFFVATDDAVYIVRVIHGSRNITPVMFESP